MIPILHVCVDKNLKYVGAVGWWTSCAEFKTPPPPITTLSFAGSTLRVAANWGCLKLTARNKRMATTTVVDRNHSATGVHF
jgi:hypothetical protein